MSSIVSIATPVRPTSPRQRGSSESRPELGGQVEGHREAGGALGEQVAVALVGLLRGGVAGVLAHRPGLLAVHLAVHAARVGEVAGLAQVELLGQVGLGVELGDLDPRVGEPAGVVGPDDRGDGQVLFGGGHVQMIHVRGSRNTSGRHEYAAGMSTCLVTGGAGFLGSHLCDELLARGHRVICVDNFETGSLRNIEHIRDPERFLHLGMDIIEPYYVEEPIDFVYHLASPASPIDYLRLPLHTLKVGSYGTHHTLGLAKAQRARFLIASTSEVYGDPLEHPQSESYWGHVNPIGPRGVYDEAKRYAEALTMAYHRQQGVDTAIVRIFNTYGARMRPHDGRAIPTFLRQALANRPLTVFGDGSQTRSFCYVSDLIRGIIALAESGHHDPVNIGNPDEFTLLELARDDQGADGSSSEIVLRGAAGRRSQAAQARHRPGAGAARLVSGGPAARGPAAHDRAVRRRGADRRQAPR